MTQKELLQDAIKTICRRAGIDKPSAFHLTLVSLGSHGIFIMEIAGSQGSRIYEELRRTVTGLPVAADSGCVALLPEVVTRIISAAAAIPPRSPSIRSESFLVPPLPYLRDGRSCCGVDNGQ